MTGRKPNKYGCETCNRSIGKSGGTSDCPLSIPAHLDVGEVYIIEKIGCASHSDFVTTRDLYEK
jgi:hypothetical protein